MQIDGLVFVPFGPSSAAMPGADDHRETIRTFREIVLVEGKRPDLLCFSTDVWSRLSADEIESTKSWPDRSLDDEDQAIIQKAKCGIEVKNSVWHYSTRRKVNPNPLSITMKAEEIEIFKSWTLTRQCPILFVQVLFDEMYCMSFSRMLDAIQRGHLYTEDDLIEERDPRDYNKVRYRFPVNGPPHLCGTVTFPTESKAHITILTDGSVIPHIEYAPAIAENVDAAVIQTEIEYQADWIQRERAN